MNRLIFFLFLFNTPFLYSQTETKISQYNYGPYNYGSYDCGDKWWDCDKKTDSTWSEKMLASYLSINSHSTFTQTQRDSILHRLSKPYVVSTFGPIGQNKTVCDFFLFFQNNKVGALTARNNSKAGATLRWDYGTGIYEQNNLPGQSCNGIITVTSIDGFSNVITFSVTINSFTNNLPSFKYFTNLTSFACYTNAFTGNLPSFLSCANLSVCSFYSNQFSGILPSFAAAITQFACNQNQFTGSFPSFLSCANLSLLYNHTNQFSGETPNFNGNKNVDIRMYSNQFTLNGTASFAKAMTVFNTSSNLWATAEVDELLLNMDNWYVGANLMTANCTVTLNGATMGIPTGGDSNVNILSLLAKATAQVKTWTIVVRTL